jgi:integrase
MYLAEQSRFKGQAGIKSSKGRLEVRLPRELFGGQQKSISLGLPDTPEGRAEADKRLRKIQLDIDTGDFDFTFERYKKPYQRQDHLAVVKELYPEIKLMDLWDKYMVYKKPLLKETTRLYLDYVTKHLEKSKITSPYKALELREYLLSASTEDVTKRVLVQMNAAFKWGMKHKLVKSPNPYEGMPQEFTKEKDKEPKPNAFTPQQKEIIINAFANHKGNWNGRGAAGSSYAHYTNFVKFMFMTGCRPSEAVGIQWQDISNNFSKITFQRGIFTSSKGKAIHTKRSKNNRIRTFPCSLKLQELLKSIKPETAKPDDLVFPSPSKKPINYNNFSRRAWDKIVNPIKPGTTPYSCRDTFITEQVGKGVAPAVIAKWVDNSVAIIEGKYLDQEALKHIRPIDD